MRSKGVAREWERRRQMVRQLQAEGYSLTRIAEMAGVSIDTVKRQRRAIRDESRL